MSLFTRVMKHQEPKMQLPLATFTLDRQQHMEHEVPSQWIDFGF